MSNEKQKNTGSKRGVAVGLAAGLLGGTAAGLVFGVPGLTSAADDASTAAGLVQQVDDTGTGNDVDTDSGTDTGDVDRPTVEQREQQMQERLREGLQELVDDGTINAAQADAVAGHLVENRPERDHDGRGPGGRNGSRAGGVMSEAVTDLLGLTPAELHEQLRAGSTLGDIAEAQGVGTDALVAEIVGEVEERIALGVENGHFDQAEADERLAEIEDRVTDTVENGRPERGGPERGGPQD